MPNDTEDKADMAEDGIGIEDARATLGELVLRAGYGNERIVLTRKGKQTAALIGIADLNRLRALSDGATG